MEKVKVRRIIHLMDSMYRGWKYNQSKMTYYNYVLLFGGM